MSTDLLLTAQQGLRLLSWSLKGRCVQKIPIAIPNTTDADDDIRAKDKRAKDKMKAL